MEALHFAKRSVFVIGAALAISTGEELPTDVGFGCGADSNLLCLTSGKSLYRTRVGVKGYQLS